LLERDVILPGLRHSFGKGLELLLVLDVDSADRHAAG